MDYNYYYVELTDLKGVGYCLYFDVDLLTLDKLQDYITEWMYNETKEAMEKIFLNGENPLFLKKEDKFGRRKEVQYLMTVPNYEFDEKDMRVYIVWAQNEDEALGMALKYEKKEGGWRIDGK